MSSMTIRMIALAGGAALALSACSPAPGGSRPGTASSAAPRERPNPSRDMMQSLGGGLRGGALRDAIARAEQHPLGSNLNPVRENQPQGQRAYLSRLRCADGTAPSFFRAGNVGAGVFGYIVDLYKVTCAGQPPVDIFIDMYHSGPENRPVPGFTIVD
jgi:hypothetical protein